MYAMLKSKTFCITIVIVELKETLWILEHDYNWAEQLYLLAITLKLDVALTSRNSIDINKLQLAVHNIQNWSQYIALWHTIVNGVQVNTLFLIFSYQMLFQ